MTSEPVTLVPGDLLTIERRYVVDGVVTCVTAKGRFAGVQVVGSAEHIVLQDTRGRKVRMFPLHTVSEITLVKGARRPDPVASPTTPAPPTGARPHWDPGVA